MSDGLTVLERAEEDAGKLKHFQKELIRREEAGESVATSDWEQLQDMAKNALVIRTKADALGLGDEAQAVYSEMLNAGGEKTPGQKKADETARMASESGMIAPNGMTLGEAVASSDAAAQFAIDGTPGSTTVIDLYGSMHAKSDSFRLAKNAVSDEDLLISTTSDAAGGLKQTPQRLSGITDLVLGPENYIRTLCTNTPVGTESVDYQQIYEKTNNASVVTESRTDEPLGAASLLLAGAPIINEVLAGSKPYSGFKTRTLTASTRWIAHLMKETEQAAQDLPRLMTYINTFLIDGLRETNDIEIFLGDGTAPDPVANTPGHLRGIMATGANAWGLQTYSRATNAGASDIDHIAFAMAQIRRYRPNGLVINPQDWFTDGFLLSKDANGQYRFGSPDSVFGQRSTMWGLNVVTSDLIPQGNMLMGNFRWCEVLDRMSPRIKMTNSNVNDFEENRITIRAENRLGVAMRNPNALVLLGA